MAPQSGNEQTLAQLSAEGRGTQREWTGLARPWLGAPLGLGLLSLLDQTLGQVGMEVKGCLQEQMEPFLPLLNWRTPALLNHQYLHPLVGGGAQWEVLVEYSEVE